MQEPDVAFAIFPLLLLLVGGIISLTSLVVWIMALVDAIKNPRLSDNERLIWVIVILLTGCLGALIYFIVGRKK